MPNTDLLYAPSEGQSLNLYLQLLPGRTADLEVVARTALAFADAIREAAYIYDPSIQIRIELESGTEGSLSLNTIIRTIRAKAAERPVVAMIIASALTWFADYTATEIMDALKGPDQVELTDEQEDQLVQKILAAKEGRIAAPQVQQVYRQAKRDPAISGLSVTLVKGEKPPPERIIPRREFAIRAEPPALPTPPVEGRRVRREDVRLVIVSPVLKVSNHVWRFNSAEGEFNARIKDYQFLGRLIAGDIVIPMRGGVALDVLLETTEEYNGVVWAPVERSILEVYGPHYPPRTGDLFPA